MILLQKYTFLEKQVHRWRAFLKLLNSPLTWLIRFNIYICDEPGKNVGQTNIGQTNMDKQT